MCCRSNPADAVVGCLCLPQQNAPNLHYPLMKSCRAVLCFQLQARG